MLTLPCTCSFCFHLLSPLIFAEGKQPICTSFLQLLHPLLLFYKPLPSPCLTFFFLPPPNSFKPFKLKPFQITQLFYTSTSNMSSLLAMNIRGVRSFASDTEQRIEFFKPLTVIVGPNGCGKTSTSKLL